MSAVRKSTSARSRAGTRRHARNASAAASIARFACSAPPLGKRATTSDGSDGFRESSVCGSVTRSPPTSIG